jgi:hypothetical protein
MRLAIVGSRNFTDYYVFRQKVEQALQEWLIEENKDITVEYVISGGASGIDSLANTWANEKECKMVVHWANWAKHGKAAGPIRNSLIISDSTHVIAFPSKFGRGTQDSIRKAKREGKKIKIFWVENLDAISPLLNTADFKLMNQ